VAAYPVLAIIPGQLYNSVSATKPAAHGVTASFHVTAKIPGAS